MIKLKSINKTYYGGAALHVLKGINLDISQGEMISIMGASGSGKSTLLNILGILDTYDTGEYYLNNLLIQNLSETKAAELYNAIKGTNYTPNMLKMNTIQNPLYYGGLRNDVSFAIEDKFVILFEHQSTVNPNMGLRCLLYIADIYKQLIQSRIDDLFRPTPMDIGTPEFYVLYNGKDKFPENDTINLSDLFRVHREMTPLQKNSMHYWMK